MTDPTFAAGPSRREFLRSAGRTALLCGLAARTRTEMLMAEQPALRRPNILFFFPDQHRGDWIGLAGQAPVRTPNLDSLARRGVWFRNAVCPSPLCAPCRAAVALGREYDRCGVVDNDQNCPTDKPTAYALLREGGYHTMGCGKFDLRKPAKSWGRDGKQVVDGKSYLDVWGFSDGIDNGGKHDGVNGYKQGKVCPYMNFLERRGLAQVHVEDFANRQQYDGKATPLDDEAYVDNWIAANGLELLAAAPKDKPWFLQVNFNGPHEPMDVTRSMKDRWKDVRFPPPRDGQEGRDHQGIRQNYAAMIENIDRWLGEYVRRLRERGELENTLIVYSSDHGEMLGDRGLWAKSRPHQPSVGVPLVLAGPGVRREWTCPAPMTNLDLSATFLEAAGLRVPADWDSRSLAPLLAGKADSHRRVVLSGLGPWRMAFDGRFKLIRGHRPEGPTSAPAGEPVLYDLQADPFETANVVADHADVAKGLLAELDAASAGAGRSS